MKHPVRRRLMYLTFLGLRALARLLPLAVARALGKALGLAAYALLRSQRRLTLEHLRMALGESLPSAQRTRVARRVFRNLGQTFMEWLWLPKLSMGRIDRLVTGEGTEHLRAALARGRGAIILTAHFGNWELITPYVRSLGIEGAALARRLRHPEYESVLLKAREGWGVTTYARDSVKEIAKLLRANRVIGMLPDQDIDSVDGIFVDFFGHPAYTPTGPAALSLLTGASIVPCFVIRDGGRFRVVVEPPLETPQHADRAQAIAALTCAWSAAVESAIRRHPDHWAWMHRRWKTKPSAVRSSKFEVRGSGSQLPAPSSQPKPVLALLLLSAFYLLLSAMQGCSKPTKTAGAERGEVSEAAAVTPDPSSTQQMSEFTLTGYEETGAKRWQLSGRGASADGDIMTIHQPDAIGYDSQRTATLTASAAEVRQPDRHVRMEHDVTIHTSDGLWLTTPVLHWIPDQNQVATDLPVRIETDHMLLRGRGASGLTQLKQATIFEDIELILNPGDHEASEGAGHVRITCDGPLTFDYEHHIATFERNVHVEDPQGDIYSDTLVAYLNEQTHTIRYAEASGRVRIHQRQNTATSERAIYEPAIGKITLVGKPSLLVYPGRDGAQTPRIVFGGLTPHANSAERSPSTAKASPE